jgi:hypothetical protein
MNLQPRLASVWLVHEYVLVTVNVDPLGLFIGRRPMQIKTLVLKILSYACFLFVSEADGTVTEQD